MSQWGDTREFNGTKFIPHIACTVWEPLHELNLVEGIYILASCGNSSKDEATLELIKSKYIGKPYKNWFEHYTH